MEFEFLYIILYVKKKTYANLCCQCLLQSSTFLLCAFSVSCIKCYQNLWQFYHVFPSMHIRPDYTNVCTLTPFTTRWFKDLPSRVTAGAKNPGVFY